MRGCQSASPGAPVLHRLREQPTGWTSRLQLWLDHDDCVARTGTLQCASPGDWRQDQQLGCLQRLTSLPSVCGSRLDAAGQDRRKNYSSSKQRPFT